MPTFCRTLRSKLTKAAIDREGYVILGKLPPAQGGIIPQRILPPGKTLDVRKVNS